MSTINERSNFAALGLSARSSLEAFLEAIEKHDNETVINSGNDILKWLDSGYTFEGHESNQLRSMVAPIVAELEGVAKAAKYKFDLIESIVNFKE